MQIRRPAVTESGVRLAVVMVASPYSGGTLPFPTYNINIPLYEPGKPGHDTYEPPSDPPPPYDGADPPINTLSASSYQSYFLPRGFIFAYAQSLGTGHSTGCPTIGGIEESLAMKAVIAWFNGIGHAYDASDTEVTAYWTTGATTMIGVSYDGTLPIAAASTGVAGLKSIVPIAGVSSYYDHRRSYGGIMMSNPTLGTDADTLFRQHPDAPFSGSLRLHERPDRAGHGSADRQLQRVVARAQLRAVRRPVPRPRRSRFTRALRTTSRSNCSHTIMCSRRGRASA